MEIFYTMVIAACISGQNNCQGELRKPGFASLAACEAQIDATASAITKRLAADPDLKGKQVTYDVMCLDRQQMLAHAERTPIAL